MFGHIYLPKFDTFTFEPQMPDTKKTRKLSGGFAKGLVLTTLANQDIELNPRGHSRKLAGGPDILVDGLKPDMVRGVGGKNAAAKHGWR